MATHRLPGAAVIVVAGVGVARAVIGLLLGFEPVDDAFITFRYADNLAAGDGFVYNDGERVLGTTTPAWTVMLAVARAMGLPLGGAAVALSLAADVVSGVLIAALLRRVGMTTGIAIAGGVVFLGMADPLGLSRTGMETSLFTCAVLSALLVGIDRRPWAAGAVVTLACALRPEGILLLPIVGVLIRRATARFLALPVVSAVVWVAWAERYFGSALPQSLQAKSGTGSVSTSVRNAVSLFAEGQWGEGPLTATWVQGNVLLTGLGLVGVLGFLRRREQLGTAPLLALVAFPSAYLTAMVAAGALTVFPWYYGPLYPFAAALAAVGIAELSSTVTRLSIRRVTAAGVGVLVVPQVMALAAVKLPAEADATWIDGLRASVKGVPDGPSTVLAAREIGVVGWELRDSYIVDLVGLVTPAVKDQRQAVAAILGFDADYVSYRTDEAPALDRAFHDDDRLDAYELFATVPDIEHGRSFVVQAKRASVTASP